MVDNEIHQVAIKPQPSKKPKADKERIKELKKQKGPATKTAALPIDEGYSKPFLRVIVAVSVF